MHKPIFKSKLNIFDFFPVISVGLGLFIFMWSRSINIITEIKSNNFFFPITVMIILMWVLSRIKKIILYKDRLIVNSPFFGSIFKEIYEIKHIEYIEFYFDKSKFGGKSIYISTIYGPISESHLFQLKDNERKILIRNLVNLGVEVKDKL